MRDDINSPSHYAEGREIEPISVIEDWQMNYHLGTVVKYVSRAGRKDDYLKDLRKAHWFLEREIVNAERKASKLASAGRHSFLVGDTLVCREGDDSDIIETGRKYQVAQVQNGHEFSFVALAEMPNRYWNSTRFELA